LKKCTIGKYPGTIFLATILLFQSGLVSARDELSDVQIQERLQVIRRMLERGKPAADRWWTGWLIGYGAATVGQGVVGLAGKDRRIRQDMALGVATTCLGALGQILTPMTAAKAPERLASIPENTPEERMRKLPEAEALLMESAVREREGRSWKIHAITGAVNLGSGLVVWLGFKRSAWEGAGNFALNTLITEAQIWTQPTRAVRDYDEYVGRYRSEGTADRLKYRRTWSIHAVPGGFGIRIHF